MPAMCPSQEKPWQDAMARVRGRVAEQVAMVLVERWWILGCKMFQQR